MAPKPESLMTELRRTAQLRFTREQVREVRLSLDSHVEWARRLGCNPVTVAECRRATGPYGPLQPDEEEAARQRARDWMHEPPPAGEEYRLVVGDPYRPLLVLHEPDRAERSDAAWECPHGRLPGDRTEPCGCFGTEAPDVPTPTKEAVMSVAVDDRKIVTMRTLGPLRLWPQEQRAELDARTLHLTRTQFKLLDLLASEPLRAWSREELVCQLWGRHAAALPSRALDQHAHRLRTELGPGCLTTVWGFGYRLLLDPDNGEPCPWCGRTGR